MLDFVKFKGSQEWGLLALRVWLGIIFAVHGYWKLFGGLTGFQGFLASLGVPAPGLAAVLVALVEFLGGLALILGVLIQVAALLTAIDILVAYLLVHMPSGQFQVPAGAEFVVLILAGLLAVLFYEKKHLYALDNTFR